jgi:hypothetical protein
MENPREDFTNRKPSPVIVEDPVTGQKKKKYNRIADAVKGIGGKQVTFGSKRGNSVTSNNVMWEGSLRKKVHITRLDH